MRPLDVEPFAERRNGERQGAADISFVAPLVDSLAGIGPVDSEEESLELGSLSLAAERAAVFILPAHAVAEAFIRSQARILGTRPETRLRVS